MLSKELEQSLNTVAQEANTKRHEFVTVEHLKSTSTKQHLSWLQSQMSEPHRRH